jgi:hypothetical protein
MAKLKNEESRLKIDQSLSTGSSLDKRRERQSVFKEGVKSKKKAFQLDPILALPRRTLSSPYPFERRTN